MAVIVGCGNMTREKRCTFCVKQLGRGLGCKMYFALDACTFAINAEQLFVTIYSATQKD